MYCAIAPVGRMIRSIRRERISMTSLGIALYFERTVSPYCLTVSGKRMKREPGPSNRGKACHHRPPLPGENGCEIAEFAGMS